MKLGPEESSVAIAEAEHERFWRYRCAEPCPGHYPVRCRRDLSHPDGHLGIGYRIASELGAEPLRWEATYVTWRGEGNAISAKVGKWRCWCDLKKEPPVPTWAIREHPAPCP